MALYAWLSLLVLACLNLTSYADVVRAEFQSCPACRLNSLPQVKRFLHKVVAKGKYPNVTVKWIPGRTPELVLFDANEKEVERMYVDKLTFNDLHTLIRQKGFKPESDGEESEADKKDKPQLTTVLQQPSNTDDSESSSQQAESTSRRSLLRAATRQLTALKEAQNLPLSRSLDIDV